MSTGMSEVNRDKNRDLDFVPTECNRACLRFKTDEEGSEYVNASYVSGK